MADRKRFTLATDIKVYFRYLQALGRMIERKCQSLTPAVLPKGTDLSVHSRAKLAAVVRHLNEQPRKTLDYETPAERFGKCVASIS